MTDLKNAEKLRDYYIKNNGRKTIINICTARPNWNGCDYCDIYAGAGLPCWKQDAKHNCIRCKEEARK